MKASIHTFLLLFLVLPFSTAAWAEGWRSRLNLDLRIDNLHHSCQSQNQVFFGRFDLSEPSDRPSIWRCHQQQMENLAIDTEAATWFTLKRSSRGEAVRMVGLGVRFRTGDGYTQVRLRGQRLSIMYRAEF